MARERWSFVKLAGRLAAATAAPAAHGSVSIEDVGRASGFAPPPALPSWMERDRPMAVIVGSLAFFSGTCWRKHAADCRR